MKYTERLKLAIVTDVVFVTILSTVVRCVKWLVLALKCINIHDYTSCFSALYNAAQRSYRLYLFWDSRDRTIVSVLG